METVKDFTFLGSQITADGVCSHEIKRFLILGRKVITNLHSILKSRDITLPTKVCLVKAMVFPVIKYGCKSWTLKKAVAAAAKSLQSCPTLCNPTRLPCPWDSPGKNTGVGCHFLLQCMKLKLFSRVRLFATPWTAAYQAPLSIGFSRQEYQSGLPLPSPGDLPNPGIEPRSSVLQTEALPFEPPGRYHYTTIKMAKIKKTGHIEC